MLGKWLKTSLLIAAIRKRWRPRLRKSGIARNARNPKLLDNNPEITQMMIISPLSGSGVAGLFSNHLVSQERFARLFAMVR